MKIIKTTTNYSRHKQSLQLYEQHKEIFGITPIDLKIKEMIREQKQNELKQEQMYKQENSKMAEIDKKNAAMMMTFPDVEEEKQSMIKNSKLHTATEMSEQDKLLKGDDWRRSKQEEQILYMGTPIYKHICNRMQMKPRTLIDKYEITDTLIKDDSIKICLRFNCKTCKADLLEPKLKKIMQ